ncbi:hypothetical protein PM082_006830 [Marasmius tenuissimus]|nr:hypothetical protein PM082_006830 [Marasmius tenuissimus]
MSFFPNSDSPKFYNGTFVAAKKVVNVKNYYGPSGEGGTSVSEIENSTDSDRFRAIIEGDLILLREVTSDIFNSKERSGPKLDLAKFKTTNPFRVRLEKRRTITHVVRKVHTAEIVGLEPRKFTVVSFDTTGGVGVDNHPKDNAKRAYALSSSERLKRTTYFSQLFALIRSDLPGLIYHDELVGGDDIRDQFHDVPIISSYLHYIFQATYFTASRDDAVRKMSITLLPYSKGWFFNLRSGSFQFDLTSPTSDSSANSQSRSEGNESSEGLSPDRSIAQRSVTLCPDIGPGLTPEKIVRHLQRVLSRGYLHSISSLGETRRVDLKSLEEFTRHRLLTFGSVLDLRNKEELVGYCPLTPRPQWYCQSYNSDVAVKYSSSVESRLKLTFNPDVEGRDWEMEIHFGLKLPFDASEQMRLAFLRQMPTNQIDDSKVESNLVFLEELRFVLHGKVSRHDAPLFTSNVVYLFIPPLTSTWIKGIPCLKWPPSAPIFYCSLNPSGRTQLPINLEWFRSGYRFPELQLDAWIGTYWREAQYAAVKEYLALEKENREPSNDMVISPGDPHLRWTNHVGGNQAPQAQDPESKSEKPIPIERSSKMFSFFLASRRKSRFQG